MKILSWYIAKDFLRYLALCLAAMVLLLLVAELFNKIETAFSGWGDFLAFLEDTLRVLPKFFEIILPIAVLLATVTAVTGFSRNHELLAMKSAGMGNFNLIVPIFAVLLPVSGLAYLNQNYLFALLNPEVNQRSATLQRNLWRSTGENIYFIESAHGAKNRLQGGSIFRYTAAPFRLQAITTFADGRHQKPGWIFKQVTRRQKSPDGWLFQRVGRWEVPEAAFPDLFKPPGLDAHHTPFLELYREIRQLEKRNPRVVIYLIEWYQKIAVLLAPFILVLVAAPLAQFNIRKGRVAGELILTLFGGLVYWISNEIFLILGKGGLLHPIAAAWGVNMTFLLLGLVVLRQAR